jgi:hypothetical protein
VRPAEREQREAAEDLGAHGVEGELERGHDAEAAAPAAQGPQELRVLAVRGAHDPPVPGDELRRQQVVAGQAVLALEPAGPAAQREAGDAGGRDAAAGDGEAVGLGGAVDLRPDRAASAACDATARVDLDVGHVAEVEDDAVVAQRQPGDRMAAGAHRDREAVLAGERERGDDVIDADAARDEPRPPPDHRVEERAGVLVSRVAGLVHAAEQTEAQFVDRRSEGRHGDEGRVRAAPRLRSIRPCARWPDPAIAVVQSRPARVA